MLTVIWLNNTNVFEEKSNEFKLLAHRGLAQTFDISKVKWDTDTSKVIYQPEHEYLENTLPSMKAAFKNGADVVELDIQITKDNKLAVFHDFELSYRTDGKGELRNYTMSQLKQLDVGYGYTADNGKTYPFRGKGVGLMPELTEVFEMFPDRDFLIHLKDTNIETAKVLWEYIHNYSDEKLSQITVYGYDEGIQYLREQSDTLRLMTKSTLKTGLIKYELLGFTGYIPKELRNSEVHIPISYAKFLWGWPNKFIKRMHSVNTRVVLIQGDGGWSEGFDDIESLKDIPDGYTGYVWTNRIDKIGRKNK